MRAHGAVGVSGVTEAQRRLGVGVARRDDARDRHRHVGAQREQRPVVVDDAVGRLQAEVGGAQRLLELDRRRGDLAVAEAVEGLEQRARDAAQRAHLLGQHVTGAAGNAQGHA